MPSSPRSTRAGPTQVCHLTPPLAGPTVVPAGHRGYWPLGAPRPARMEAGELAKELPPPLSPGSSFPVPSQRLPSFILSVSRFPPPRPRPLGPRRGLCELPRPSPSCAPQPLPLSRPPGEPAPGCTHLRAQTRALHLPSDGVDSAKWRLPPARQPASRRFCPTSCLWLRLRRSRLSRPALSIGLGRANP